MELNEHDTGSIAGLWLPDDIVAASRCYVKRTNRALDAAKNVT